MRPFPVRRPADTDVDIEELEVDDSEVVVSGMFEKARTRAAAAPAAPEEPMELSASDVELVKLMREEPTEVSASDIEVVKFLQDHPIEIVEAPLRPRAIMRPREPTNPCIAFERTFAAEFAKTLASTPIRYTPPARQWPPARVAFALPSEPVGDPMSDVVPMPRAVQTSDTPAHSLRRRAATVRAPRRRKSLIPRATLLMGLVVLGGFISDEARAGRFDRVIGTASAWIDSALGR